jgi:PHD/YefM family antitoxin component YafN of YafNO toxin-antitoxin module
MRYQQLLPLIRFAFDLRLAAESPMMYNSLVHVMKDPMAPPIVTISTARQRFFSLFESVTSHRGRKVVISSRGSENHAVLVGEAYLNELEAAAKRLRDIESGNANPASAFRLIGSGRIADGVEDPLADLRRDGNALAEKKLASFGK